MPAILRWRGYKFLFYSKEEGEPPHVHVLRDRCQAKFWLVEVRLARSVGFKEHELMEIKNKVQECQRAFLEAWHEYFGNA